MRIRRATVDHTFGTLKAWMGYTHFKTRTLDKVRPETNLGIATVGAADRIELRDLQTFSYGGNNASGGARFEMLVVPAVIAVPKPGVWVMMVGGFAILGARLRVGQAFRREHEVAGEEGGIDLGCREL